MLQSFAFFGACPAVGGLRKWNAKGVKKATLSEQPFGAASPAILALYIPFLANHEVAAQLKEQRNIQDSPLLKPFPLTHPFIPRNPKPVG